ncbi:MAG: hypothetical protein KGJ06_10260, partial [Pseudomonadota bacterium]|nr:hypothetical protein [Pseudomonadota bacterium]
MSARESEAIILAKSVPLLDRQGDALCSVGVTPKGEWLRLYQKPPALTAFARWTHIKFRRHASAIDSRPESCDVEPNSIRIIGELPPSRRHDLLSLLETHRLEDARRQGKSLALLHPSESHFCMEQKTKAELAEEERQSAHPCPYRFKYRYTTESSEGEAVFHDWGLDNN